MNLLNQFPWIVFKNLRQNLYLFHKLAILVSVELDNDIPYTSHVITGLKKALSNHLGQVHSLS